MLAEMPRQILDRLPQPPECLDRRMLEIEADLAQVARQRFLRIDPLEMIHHFREPIDLRRLERQYLADFARGAPAAIGDDIGGHRDRGPTSVTPGVRRRGVPMPLPAAAVRRSPYLS